MVYRLLGVLVAAVVAQLREVSMCTGDWTLAAQAYPDIEAFLDQEKGQCSLSVRETHPDLAVH